MDKFKMNCSISVQRLKMQINKRQTTIKNATRREVVDLLRKGKDESARIRTESMLREQNMVTAMEITLMQLELLINRRGYINDSEDCPKDMLETCASVVYVASRLGGLVPELHTVAFLLDARFGRTFAALHKDNRSEQVNRKLVQLLKVSPPPFQKVLQVMQGIAKSANFDWAPKTKEAGGGDSHQVIGSSTGGKDTRIENKEDDGADMAYVGTLNVSVHKAQELYQESWLGNKKPFVRVFLIGDAKRAHQTKPGNGPNPEWKSAHFPFHISGRGQVLRLQLCNASSARDEVMASLDVPVIDIEPGVEPRWFPFDKPRSWKNPDLCPKVSLSFQYMLLNEGKVEPIAEVEPDYVPVVKGVMIDPDPPAFGQAVDMRMSGSPMEAHPVAGGISPMSTSGELDMALPAVPNEQPAVGLTPGMTPGRKRVDDGRGAVAPAPVEAVDEEDLIDNSLVPAPVEAVDEDDLEARMRRLEE